MTHTHFVPGREPASVPTVSHLRAGDWVRVRSREEILATLDANGCLDGMPFMPEMLAYCGRTLRVFKRAHKTCDTICGSGLRRLERTVHLEDARCDGSAHGGCEAACLLFWKEAWLAPAEADPAARAAGDKVRSHGCTVEQLAAAAIKGHDPGKGPCYACQTTELLRASRPIARWDLGHFVDDFRSRNIDLATFCEGAVYRMGTFLVRRAERLGQRLGMGDVLARAVMAGYDAVQTLLPRGMPYPRRTGTVPKSQPTPDVGLGRLGPGSVVRVKPYREILATLDASNKTRGLYFDAEHVPYCGRELPIRSLVRRIIDERTGYMLQFKTPSIILQGAYCQGSHSDRRMFCPRAIYPYWRAAWLEPVQPRAGETPKDAGPGPG